jgi:hypothetical protein
MKLIAKLIGNKPVNNSLNVLTASQELLNYRKVLSKDGLLFCFSPQDLDLACI